MYLDRDETGTRSGRFASNPATRSRCATAAQGVMTAELVGMEGDGGRDAGVAAVASVGEVRRAPFAGPRWRRRRVRRTQGRTRRLARGEVRELGAASLVPLLTERSPTVGGAERDKSNKEKHGGEE